MHGVGIAKATTKTNTYSAIRRVYKHRSLLIKCSRQENNFRTCEL